MFGSWLAAAGRVLLLTHVLGYRLRYRDAFVVAVAGEFGVAVSPAGVGGTALPLGFLHTRGLRLTAATTAVAADVAPDAIAALLLLPQGRELGGELAAGVEFGFDPCLDLGRRRPAPFSARSRRHLALVAPSTQNKAPLEARSPPPGPRRPGRLLHDHPRTVVLTFLLAILQFACRNSIMPMAVLALDPDDPAILLALYPLQGLINGIAHAASSPAGAAPSLAATARWPSPSPPTPVMSAVLARHFTFYCNVILRGGVFLVTLGRVCNRNK